MNLLLHEITGWLGYFHRQEVLTQTVIALAPLLLAAVFVKIYGAKLGSRGHLLVRAAVFACIATGIGILAALDQPFGLDMLALRLCALWYALRAAVWFARHRVAAEELRRFDASLLRPAFFLFATLSVVRHMDSLSALAVIPLGDLFGAPMNVGKAFFAVTGLYFGLAASGLVARVIAWMVHGAFALHRGSRRAVQLLTQYTLVALIIIMHFSGLGMNPTALLAIGGGLSVGLGFGVKEVFSNFVSGIWLLMEGAVRPGDILFIHNEPCEVRKLGLRAALLWRKSDNAELLVPNQTFFTKETTSYTRTDSNGRTQVQVSASVEHDPKTILKLLERTTRDVPDVLADPPPQALVLEHGASSITYSVRFLVSDPMKLLLFNSNVNAAIWEAFEKHQIER